MSVCVALCGVVDREVIENTYFLGFMIESAAKFLYIEYLTSPSSYLISKLFATHVCRQLPTHLPLFFFGLVMELDLSRADNVSRRYLA